jgi:hypothetical protein
LVVHLFIGARRFGLCGASSSLCLVHCHATKTDGDELRMNRRRDPGPTRKIGRPAKRPIAEVMRSSGVVGRPTTYQTLPSSKWVVSYFSEVGMRGPEITTPLCVSRSRARRQRDRRSQRANCCRAGDAPRPRSAQPTQRRYHRGQCPIKSS